MTHDDVTTDLLITTIRMAYRLPDAILINWQTVGTYFNDTCTAYEVFYLPSPDDDTSIDLTVALVQLHRNSRGTRTGLLLM